MVRPIHKLLVRIIESQIKKDNSYNDVPNYSPWPTYCFVLWHAIPFDTRWKFLAVAFISRSQCARFCSGSYRGLMAWVGVGAAWFAQFWVFFHWQHSYSCSWRLARPYRSRLGMQGIICAYSYEALRQYLNNNFDFHLTSFEIKFRD